MRAFGLSLAVLLGASSVAGSASAQYCPTGNCAPPAPAFQQQVIRETVMVPQTVMQRQTVAQQEIQYQQRQNSVTVYDRVPQVVNVQQTQTVMTTETRLQPQTTTGYEAYYRTEQRPIQVPVQQLEARTGIRQVAKMVPTRVQKIVTTKCNCTHSAPGMQTVQTAGKETQSIVEVVENRPTLVNEQYTYQVPVTRYETRMQDYKVLDYRPTQKTVNVPVQVQVPKQQVSTQQVIQYRTVPRQVVTTSAVAVPVTVQRHIDVPVTQMVPRSVERVVNVPVVQQPLPACSPTGCTNAACPTCQGHGVQYQPY
jgi:hypothetical protein